jgi:hypothetical protein
LSRLFSLEQDVIHDIFKALNLVGKRNIKEVPKVNANHDSWDAFLSTYRLDAEVTSFEILKRRYVFICLCYWDEKHLKKTPGNIWKDSCNHRVPKVTLGTPLMRFAKAVGEFIVTEPSCSPRLAADSSGITSSDEYSSCFDDASDSESSLCTGHDQEMKNNSDVPHKDDFPLLNKFQIPLGNLLIRDKLLQEIVKFSGGKVIKYNQACNKPGTLTRIPSAKNLKQYTVHMCKKESFLDEMINVMSECTNEPKINAAECLCHALCQKYEDAFASIVEKKRYYYM